MAKGSEFFDPISFLRRVQRGETKASAAGVAALKTAGLFAFTLETFLRVKLGHARGQGESLDWRISMLSGWGRGLLKRMNVVCEIRGAYPPKASPSRSPRGRLLLCNHQTYFDILAVSGNLPTHIVSSAMVRDWPVIGPGAALAGVLFVDRSSAESRKKIQDEVWDMLRQGRTVLNFPEGANFKGPGMAPFKPGLFRLVAGQPVDIVPITIRYPRNVGAEWVGDNPEALAAGAKIDGGTRLSFIEHVINMMSGPPLRLRMHVGEAIACEKYPEMQTLLDFVRGTMLEQLEKTPPAESPGA
jgi:1-acyl-sn-glycerol-3-phosphate acyltransferase